MPALSSNGERRKVSYTQQIDKRVQEDRGEGELRKTGVSLEKLGRQGSQRRVGSQGIRGYREVNRDLGDRQDKKNGDREIKESGERKKNMGDRGIGRLGR